MTCPNHGAIWLPAFVVMVVCGCSDKGGTASRSEAESEVQAAWAELKEASLAGNGERAAGRVTNSTHNYYEEIRRLALEASQDELGKHVFMKRYTILGMRLRMPAEQLRSMSGRDLFVYSIDQGWIGKDSATDEGIGEVTVTGNHARAVATKAGQPIQQYYHFVKEGGVWRLDMLQLMKFANAAFDQMLQDSGMTEAQFTKRFLEATTGKTVTDDLWIPPNDEQNVRPQ